MGERVTDLDLAGNPRVVHFESGQMLDDGIIPRNFLFVDEDAEGCGGESLGVGGDAEERAVVDGSGIAEFADSVALGDDDFSILDDGEGHAGNVEGLHGALHPSVEISGWSGLGDGETSDKEEGEEKGEVPLNAHGEEL